MPPIAGPERPPSGSRSPRVRLPRIGSGPAVIVLGLSWCLGVLYANRRLVAETTVSWPEALIVSLPGGLAMAGVSWASFCAVLWGMLRLLGCRPGVPALLGAVAAATPALWLMAPLLALSTGPDAGTVEPLLALLAGIGFLAYVSRALGTLEEVGVRRGALAPILAVIFIASLFVLLAP